MAQALFDEHPLEQYLRNAGEARDIIPGSTADLELELDPMWGMDVDEDPHEDSEDLEEWRPLFLIKIMEVISAAISALDLPSHPSRFVERFKYDVISSSLLAVALQSAHIRTPRLSLPGQLDHSRTSSLENQQHTPTPSPPVVAPHDDASYIIPFAALIMVAVSFHAGYILLALASLAITVYTFQALHDVPKHDMSPSLESLNDLIASSNEWESVVHEAISVLENDERNASYGPATPISPSSSSIRVALHSSLLTTQTQCDNVRQLFSALTSPSELSQLSEMYAPPSPMVSSFLQDGNTRPLSLPARRRTLSTPIEPFLSVTNKRQTWNGSYNKIPLDSPSNQVFKRREKRRSDLSALLHVSSSPSVKSISAPVTPVPSSLPHVSEEHEDEAESDYEDAQETIPVPLTALEPSFGTDALALHRKRRSAGMEAFQMPPPSYFSPSPTISPLPSALTPQTPRTPPTATLTSGSRFTPIQASRHPLSLSALNSALQAALASKRYACSHLLALRFADEEDEGYWEDVRSVMGLLTSTLVDASSRLSGALLEVEQQKLRDQNPTPCMTTFPGSQDSDKSVETDSPPSSPPPPMSKGILRRPESISFAPLPSQVSRFAAHVEAIMSAIDDARDNLEQCVAALRDETRAGRTASQQQSIRQLRQQHHQSRASVDEQPPVVTSSAMDAYERLRRELGLALRECERGRERLLDVVHPPEVRRAEVDEDEDSGEDVPALGTDGSDESDKPDRSFPYDDEGEQGTGAEYAVVADAGVALDDATAHLLLATSVQHLPPPGIEQVFEADSGNVGMFMRERSKLTREERIKLVKARRESGGSVLGSVDLSPGTNAVTRSSKVERWGPGGEVVQELKDVIWKVGERRRRMADSAATLDSVAPSEARSDSIQTSP
ncbi:hypothetical protein DXG03_001621 [Asterophora parasitica]|uniref:Myosin-binding domain-containing protein n=1 Tax=Asterophora parasitica TaxID=117018 RepID=A0A9P7KBG8_9AGAR|nr:hypothetical protein DXG03_001621 [Asterophora parasitica]